MSGTRRGPSTRPWRINAADHEAGAAVWILTGLPGAGKSTAGRSLAERLPRSAHVPGDVFGGMLVGGAAPATSRPSAEALRQLRLRHRLAAATADGYAAAGFDAVLDDVVVGVDLPALAAAVQTRPAYLVVLSPPVGAIRARAAARSPSAPRLDALDRILRRQTPRLGLWLNTATQTAEETVEEILARREEARLG